MTHPPGNPTDPGGGDGTTGPGRRILAANQPDPMPTPEDPRPKPTDPPGVRELVAA